MRLASLGDVVGRVSFCRAIRPLIAQQGPTRKQAIDLQAAILAALRKRDGTTVVREGAPMRWQLLRISCRPYRLEGPPLRRPPKRGAFMTDFAIGEVVRLKSGGHGMTVQEATEDGTKC